jgi:hypothetical protein
MSRISRSSKNIFHKISTPPLYKIQTTKIDIKDFFNSISNNREIKFDNVLIDNISELIDGQYTLKETYSF